MSDPSGVRHLVGVRGPEALVSARIAALLERHAGLDQFRLARRGFDAELDETLEAVHRAAMAWRRQAGTQRSEVERTGTPVAAQPEPAAPSKAWLWTGEAAGRLGVSPRWILKLIERGDLEAERRGSRWRIRRESVDAYREMTP